MFKCQLSEKKDVLVRHFEFTAYSSGFRRHCSLATVEFGTSNVTRRAASQAAPAVTECMEKRDGHHAWKKERELFLDLLRK